MKFQDSQIENIFFAALDLASPEERAEYLEGACGGDADLRARVELLLGAHPRLGSFLQAPAAVALSPGLAETPLAEAPGDVIGPYRLLEQIGEGGFGVVFMAEPWKRPSGGRPTVGRRNARNTGSTHGDRDGSHARFAGRGRWSRRSAPGRRARVEPADLRADDVAALRLLACRPEG